MSIDPKASRFWRAALRAGLIDVEGLDSCLAGIDLATCPPDSFDRRLARRAVDAGMVTLWQAQQLVLGRWQGLKVGKYVLVDALGEGGMGTVYLAQDTRLRRRVAMKFLSRKRSSNPRAVARFEREARIGGQLQHEHLTRVYDDGEIFGQRFLVMEYIDGKNVAQLLDEHRRLPPALAAELARQVALGLDHLHRKGLLHRDVSISNIMIDREGTAKLTDLGLAFDPDDEDVLTREGSTVGSFDYISPEQSRDSHSVDIRSDIYSLGCTLYHMIGGRAPFLALTVPEKLLAHQLSEADPLTSLAPACPAELEAVVHRTMRKAASERFADPAELARALAPFASGPIPLNLFAGAASGDRTERAAAAAEPEAYTAEWIEASPELGIDVPSAGSTGSQDVFRKIELGEAAPGPASTTPDPSVAPRFPEPALIVAIAVAVAAGLLAIGLILRW